MDERLLAINFAVPVPLYDRELAIERLDSAWESTKHQVMRLYDEYDGSEEEQHREWFGIAGQLDDEEEDVEYED